ncbi:hypothetical protein SAMN05421819_4039 [Bryocella elongata]|uniref:Uncharacterized protein n=1 Tax=Bryocella elongata TaxID=863522 RepID=A0A1H6BYF4_9BACT|nr:hypothetical protein [Bryocella elongata]SEG65465.1 hypothetical protein SAMN05421819_4039 [Bryocella elongata]
MARRVFVRRFFLVSAVALVSVLSGSLSSAEGFDKPVRKVVLDLGPSPNQPDYPNLHVRVSCYYYPTFMVKEWDDDGNKGSMRVSVLHVSSEHAPACARALRREEKVVAAEGFGYWGTKGELLFLLAPDGEGAGILFDAFDLVSKRKIYADALRFNVEPAFGKLPDGRVSMRYERIYFAKCSLMDTGPNGGASCLRQVKLRTGLGNVPMPKCKGYGQDGDLFNDAKDPSLIGYPVEVVLSPKSQRKILAGPVHCFAAQ